MEYHCQSYMFLYIFLLPSVQHHHILLWKMFLEPVQASPDRVPVFKALCANNCIVNRGRVSGHRCFLPAEAIRNGYFFFWVDMTIKRDGNFFTIPINCFLFRFFHFHIFLLSCCAPAVEHDSRRMLFWT